jgi:hypothetical protein
MVRLKMQYMNPNSRYVNGLKYNVVKVKRHRIHPAHIAEAMSLWQVIVESLMERHPWAFISNVGGWFIYKIKKWTAPKFAVPTAGGRRVSVPYRKEIRPDWVVITSKKAQR